MPEYVFRQEIELITYAMSDHTWIVCDIHYITWRPEIGFHPIQADCIKNHGNGKQESTNTISDYVTHVNYYD